GRGWLGGLAPSWDSAGDPAVVGCRSLAHSRVFHALAVECAWSLPVRRGLAAVRVCVRPVAERRWVLPPVGLPRRRPATMPGARDISCCGPPSQGGGARRGREQSPITIGPRAAAPTCWQYLG